MLRAPVLDHPLLVLEPLAEKHIPGLAAVGATAEDQPEFATVPTAKTAADYVRRSLERAEGGDYAPFAQLTDGRVVGHTAFLTPRRWPGTDRLYAVEIGSSYLHASVQGSALNTVAKLLLMTHAFDIWKVDRVDIKTDARNDRARAGIQAVGARLEGILRGWQPSDAPGESGQTRDTAMHSVVAGDWPDIRTALGIRIAAKRQAR